MKVLKAILLFCMLSVTLGMNAQKQPRCQTVYIFGFSASFADSVAFLTDVMRVDSAYIMPNGFLADRSLYSLQLENYVLGTCKVQNSTNCVFFSTKKKELEKKYNKVNRIYQRSENLALIYVGEDDFRFQAQEYIDPTIVYGDPEDDARHKDVPPPPPGGGMPPAGGKHPAGGVPPTKGGMR